MAEPFLAASNLGSDLIVIARGECGECKTRGAILGLFEVLYFPFELICVCARLSANKLHCSHGLT